MSISWPRLIAAAVAAPVIWGVCQAGGNLLLQTLFPGVAPGAESIPMGYLVGALLLSLVYGVVSGAGAARIAAADLIPVVIAAGGVLLAVGLAVQISFWDVLPTWWHLTFLAMILPSTACGARLAASRPA